MIRAAVMTLLVSASAGAAQTDPKGDSAASAQNCAALTEQVRFCGTASDFVPVGDPGSAVFDTPQGVQAIAIIEDMAPAANISVTDLQRAAIDLAAATADEAPMVIERGTSLVSGTAHPTIIYRATFDGQMYVYSNTFVVMDDAFAQFITVEPDVTTYSPRHRSVHMRFLAHMRMNA